MGYQLMEFEDMTEAVGIFIDTLKDQIKSQVSWTPKPIYRGYRAQM